MREILIYLALAALIGYMGKYHRLGFWGYFFVSILFTPVIALLIVLVANPNPRPSQQSSK